MTDKQKVIVNWEKCRLVGSCNVCQDIFGEGVYDVGLGALRFRVCRAHAKELIEKLAWFEPSIKVTND